mgnify:FL=1
MTDLWGDGIYTPMGYYTAYSSDGSMIEQVYDIPDFGARSIFRTSKETAGIGTVAGHPADGDVKVYRLDGTVAYSGKRDSVNLPAGVYVVYDADTRTVTKQIIK